MKDSSLKKNQHSIGQQTFGEADQGQSSCSKTHDSDKLDNCSISKKNLGELIQYSLQLVSEMGNNNSNKK